MIFAIGIVVFAIAYYSIAHWLYRKELKQTPRRFTKEQQKSTFRSIQHAFVFFGLGMISACHTASVPKIGGQLHPGWMLFTIVLLCISWYHIRQFYHHHEED